MGRKSHGGSKGFAIMEGVAKAVPGFRRKLEERVQEQQGIPTSAVGMVGPEAKGVATDFAQRLKIAKSGQSAPETKKKPVSLAKPSVTPKKKPTGAGPASAIAGGLGSSSGGSVRL